VRPLQRKTSLPNSEIADKHEKKHESVGPIVERVLGWLTNLALSQETEKFPSRHKVHYHVQVVDIVESSPQIYQKWMSYSNKHLPLRVGVLDLLHPDDLLLVEHLDGIEPSVMLGSNEMNTTERTRSESEV